MKESKYPKIYATVVSREGTSFIAETDEGEQIQLSVGDRTGYGHHSDIQPGLRIKIYKRTGENYKFRFVGS
jgi:hypothetical protein